MKYEIITAVGIDVSKGKSTVAVRRPGGEVVLTPFQVNHDAAGLFSLVKTLQDVGGNIRVVMEHTGMYWRPIALALKEAGFFVSVVNAMLIHDFSDNSLRKVKTDKADSMKIANYALSFWAELRDYSPEDETRQMLKMQNRLYLRTQKSSVTLRNGLISLLDQAFPGVNTLFDTQPKRSNGHFKWVDFVKRFWHRDCVAGVSLAAFSDAYRKWCARSGYRFSPSDAEKLHTAARNAVTTFPKNDSTKLLIAQAVDSLNAVYDALYILRGEMLRLASLLPEFDVVTRSPGRSSWRRLAMCGGSPIRALWWPLRAWTRRLSSPVHSTPSPAASPSAVPQICEKPCSWSSVRSSSTRTRPIPYFSSWTKSGPRASTFMFTWWLARPSFCVSIMPG